MTGVSFRVLGPLDVVAGGAACSLGGAKPRMLLASLLLQPGVPVSAEALVEVLWPAGAPRSAIANLRTYVHTLRKQLPDQVAGRIERSSAGYLVKVNPGELDLAVFVELADAARQALRNGQRERALNLLDDAAQLWRGGMLADLTHSHSWAPTIARLTEQRLWVRQQRLELQLGRGEHEEAIVELRGLLAEHPLREELWQQLIRALDATGRSLEAEQAYQQLRELLRAELGAEPSVALGSLLSTSEQPTLCQLPLDLPDFTGRRELLKQLSKLLDEHGGRETPAVAVLSGAPGTGKSALAVHLAHLLRERFPDGQLYLDLGGTSAAPPSPLDLLAELLRALGVPDAAVPPSCSARAGLLRARLTGSRFCLLLDDAATAEQVRPLLPGAGRSVVLVTSRTRLPDLAGARHFEVDVLAEDEATELLAKIVGAECRPAQDILRYCGFLPLAIRVAGAKLAHRPQWTPQGLASRLRDERHRLDELRIGDLAVRASVELSYQQLGEQTAALFRGLGTLGAMRFPGWVAGALLGRPDAQHELDELVDAHLVEPLGQDAAGQSRYRLHDLLRCYATERSAEHSPAAMRSVVEGYCWLATDAAARMPINFFGIVPEPRAKPTGTGEPMPDPHAWFAAERASCVATVALAAESGMDDLAWRLAAACAPYFDLRGHQSDWRYTHELALDAAERAGDRRGAAIVRRNLAQLHLYLDADADALAAFSEAHRLFTEVGDEQGVAIALSGLGTVYRVLGDHHAALRHCTEALDRFVAAGDRPGEAVARIAVGSVWLADGRYEEAERWFLRACELSAEIGDRHREAHALKRLAMLQQRRGNLGRARELVDRAITIFAELGDEHCVGYANQHLGELYLRSGDLAHARLLLVNSLLAHQRTGDRRSTADVAESLGTLHEALRQPERSGEYFRRASDIRTELSAQPPPETPTPGGAASA